jgi:hypothetical protein
VRVLMREVRPMDVLERVERVVMVLLMVLMTKIGGVRCVSYVFFRYLELCLMCSVTFPLVLVMRGGGRRRRFVMMFRNGFFVNGFLVGIRRGEDA